MRSLLQLCLCVCVGGWGERLSICRGHIPRTHPFPIESESLRMGPRNLHLKASQLLVGQLYSLVTLGIVRYGHTDLCTKEFVNHKTKESLRLLPAINSIVMSRAEKKYVALVPPTLSPQNA